MWILLAAAALGVLAGVLAGLFGIGGGILFVPTLTLVLGLTQLHAEATSLLAIIPTALVGAWRQAHYGNVRWRAALVIGVAAIGGVEAGVQIAESLPEHVLRRLFAVLMLAVAAQVAWRAWRPPQGRSLATPTKEAAPASPVRPSDAPSRKPNDRGLRP
jgi:uncharacterized membrane protein YfcA